jgi:hypothetical protein
MAQVFTSGLQFPAEGYGDGAICSIGRTNSCPLGNPDIGLAKARELYQDARTLLASGTDPMAARKAKKAASDASSKHSFQTVAMEWLAHWRDGKSERHADTVERRMQTDILPALGARDIRMIEAPEIAKMVRGIQDRGAIDIAKRALETTGQIFRCGIAFGFTKRNLASEIRPRDVLKSRDVVNFARIDRRDLPKLHLANHRFELFLVVPAVFRLSLAINFLP